MMWGEEMARLLAESSVTANFICLLATINRPQSAVQLSTPSFPAALRWSEPDARTQSIFSTTLP
jgi:hypothetical protein